MSKNISISGFAVAVVAFLTLFGMYGVASAASITNIKFDNGQTTTQCTAGQSVNAVVRLVVPVGEVAEIGQTDVIGDALSPSLPFNLGGQNGLEEGAHDVNVSFPCPPNTGTYTVEIRTAGIFGGQRAVVITDGVTTVASFGGALRVVGTSSGSSSVGVSEIAALQAQIAELLKLIEKLQNPPAPTKPAYCTSYATAAAGGTFSLQMWLVQNNFMTQAAMNTGPGIYGPKTTAANQAAMLACK